MGNSPFIFVDPNGEFVILGSILLGAIIKGALIGAAVSAAVQLTEMAILDEWDYFDAGSFAKNVGIGALTGAVAAGVGTAFGGVTSGGGLFSKVGEKATRAFSPLRELGRAAVHGATQGGISAANGGDFWGTFKSTAIGSAVGSVGGGAGFGRWGQLAAGSISAGLVAEFSGGDFLDGAATAAVVMLANHWLHEAFAKTLGKPLSPEEIKMYEEIAKKHGHSQAIRMLSYRAGLYKKDRELSRKIAKTVTDYMPVVGGVKSIEKSLNGYGYKFSNGKYIKVPYNNKQRILLGVSGGVDIITGGTGKYTIGSFFKGVGITYGFDYLINKSGN